MTAKKRRNFVKGLTDVTRQLNETQQVALLRLLTFLEPGERGVDWDWDNPAEFDNIELSRLCLLAAWPVDDWNRQVAATSTFTYDEHGHVAENPSWKAEEERRVRLLEEFRSEPVAE